MIEKIWEVLTTFTEESKTAALDKCTENGFDVKRGVVSLDESFINLNSAKSILIDSIEKRKLIQLPISIQKTILSNLESISRSLTNLINGTDEIENLSSHIEELNVSIWQYGLHNLSDELLGFLNKMNQIKIQEVEIATMKRDLEKTMIQKAALESLVATANEAVNNLKIIVAESESNKNKTEENVATTIQVNQNASELLSTIQQNESTSTQLLANTKASNSEVVSIEPKIMDFFSQIDNYKNKINSTTEDVGNIVESNKKETDKLINNLKELEDQIKIQIEKATGFSLFHSFQTRQYELARSKKFWIYALGGLVLASWGVSIFVISTTTNFDVAFFGKLSMTLPLIYAIYFCTVHYGRERKLEEEYAFKSNISISLIPYQELVEKLIKSDEPGEREKFTAFIIDAITKVYTSPTDKVFDSEQKSAGDPIDLSKQLEKIIKSIVEPLGPLLNVIKH